MPVFTTVHQFTLSTGEINYIILTTFRHVFEGISEQTSFIQTH